MAAYPTPLQSAVAPISTAVLLLPLYLAGPSWAFEVRSAALQQRWLATRGKDRAKTGPTKRTIPTIVGVLGMRHGSPLASFAAIASAVASTLLGIVVPL
jgi:hypothetical protein